MNQHWLVEAGGCLMTKSSPLLKKVSILLDIFHRLQEGMPSQKDVLIDKTRQEKYIISINKIIKVLSYIQIFPV